MPYFGWREYLFLRWLSVLKSVKCPLLIASSFLLPACCRMTSLIETIAIETAKIACDGDPASPHPRVFLVVNAEKGTNCPYCGKHFVLKKGAGCCSESSY